MFFETNSLLKETHKERLTKIIDSFFHATDKHTKANFCGYMKLYEINAIIREGRDRRVYRLTLVDNRKCTVFNGSELGKGYSGQALIKRFEMKPTLVKVGEKERHEITSQGSEFPQLQFRDLSLPHWMHDIAKEFLNVMKAEKHHEEPIPPSLKKKKRAYVSENTKNGLILAKIAILTYIWWSPNYSKCCGVGLFTLHYFGKIDSPSGQILRVRAV